MIMTKTAGGLIVIIHKLLYYLCHAEVFITFLS